MSKSSKFLKLSRSVDDPWMIRGVPQSQADLPLDRDGKLLLYGTVEFVALGAELSPDLQS
jgi:hypothetical protein